MRLLSVSVSLAAVALTASGCSDDGKLPPDESVASACSAFVGVADTREAKRAAAKTAMDSARAALAKAPTPAALAALVKAEQAALDAEHEYAQSPDVSIVAIAFAAEEEEDYQPVLTAFLSGDVVDAKNACRPFALRR